MTLKEICTLIDLQPEMTSRVLAFADTSDVPSYLPLMNGFDRRETYNDAVSALKNALGKDEDNVKITACMLYKACVLHDTFYREKGIGDDIFRDTMACFTRFIGECVVKTGRVAFDREWWVPRQLSGVLFRVGVLEYELTADGEGQKCVSIHIPSGSDLTRENCVVSLHAAKAFLRQFFPAYADVTVCCHSWLLSDDLRANLPEGSRIRQFQDLFDRTPTGARGNGFILWLFQTDDTTHIEPLIAKTSLQKKMKDYLLRGGVLDDVKGVVKKEYLC